MENRKLSQSADLLVGAFENEEGETSGDKKISVNRVVSEVASWYEKLRNSMDYRADEVILRAAIERILKRRILLGGTGKKIAGPLVRELIWARYFPDSTVPEGIIEQVSSSIDLFLHLREKINKFVLSDNKIAKKHRLKESIRNEWIYHLMSSDLEQILNPNQQEDTMRNFMFHLLRPYILIADDSQETRDAQVFLAVCRSFSNDDTAFLRSHLFRQFFGAMTIDNIDTIADGFLDYYKEVEKQLAYPLKDRIYSYIVNQTPPFLILQDVLVRYKGTNRNLIVEEEELKKAIFQACTSRYGSISAKVRRAIIRSVIFVLLTKALFALSIEGTYETLFYGKVSFSSMLVNISIPPILMIIVGIFIRTPGRDNSQRILNRIETILFDEEPKMGTVLALRVKPDRSKPLLNFIFSLLWLLAFAATFGFIYIILNSLHFNIVNKGVFMFFFAIVSFLSYRISQMAYVYNFQTKQSLLAPITDFFFLPLIRVGRRLTEGIAQVNIFLFILDFIFETPFKGIFAFFEQWFLFLHTKREELG